MPKFYYSGVTRQRENVNGVLDVPDELEARMKLRAMQIRPTTLTQKAPGSFAGFNFAALKSVGGTSGVTIPLKSLVVFTRQFSSLIDSGVPIVQCLNILAEQERRAGFKRVLTKIKEDIESGAGLAESLQKHPKCFSEFFVRVVEAGEMSGTLDTAVRRVGAQLEKLGRLKAKVIGAMIYPGATMVIAIIVLIFLLVKVIPEIAKLYTDSNAKLPDITLAVLALSRWVQDNFLLIIFGLVASGLSVVVLSRSPGFRKHWDPIALKIPLFGGLIQKSAIARFSRTMSTLVSSGVPLLTAFDICAKLMSNLAIRGNIERASASVAEGKTMAAGLAVKGIFPPMVIHMVNIGEMTGKLDELLAKVADIYDDEVDDAVSNLTGLINPVMIIVVGIMIAFLLVAMYLPIFQLADKVAG
jgi:type IV pilus assembly protein PilC